MKYLFIIAALLMFLGCSNQSIPPTILRTVQLPCKPDTVFVHDTAYEMNRDVIDSLRYKIFILENTGNLVDSLRFALFNEKYKIARVRFYLKIAIHKPSQTRFLTSWISRAIQ